MRELNHLAINMVIGVTIMVSILLTIKMYNRYENANVISSEIATVNSIVDSELLDCSENKIEFEKGTIDTSNNTLKFLNSRMKLKKIKINIKKITKTKILTEEYIATNTYAIIIEYNIDKQLYKKVIVRGR